LYDELGSLAQSRGFILHLGSGIVIPFGSGIAGTTGTPIPGGGGGPGNPGGAGGAPGIPGGGGAQGTPGPGGGGGGGGTPPGPGGGGTPAPGNGGGGGGGGPHGGGGGGGVTITDGSTDVAETVPFMLCIVVVLAFCAADTPWKASVESMFDLDNRLGSHCVSSVWICLSCLSLSLDLQELATLILSLFVLASTTCCTSFSIRFHVPSLQLNEKKTKDIQNMYYQ